MRIESSLACRQTYITPRPALQALVVLARLILASLLKQPGNKLRKRLKSSIPFVLRGAPGAPGPQASVRWTFNMTFPSRHATLPGSSKSRRMLSSKPSMAVLNSRGEYRQKVE